MSSATVPHASGGRQHLLFPESEQPVPPVGEKELGMSEGPVNVTQMQAAEELGGPQGELKIKPADGGYILSWKEAVVIPETQRRNDWERFNTISRTAVREDLGAALELARSILQESKVKGSKWG